MKRIIFNKVSRRLLLASILLCSIFTVTLFQPGSAKAAGAVTINYSSVVNSSVSPLLFGGSNEPWPTHDANVYPQLKSVGLKFQRGTIHVDVILPKNITLSDYQNNVNNVQNPDTWDWTALSWATNAQSRGITTMANLFQAPAWLTYNGNYNGVPSNWSVWQDIVKKIYTRYQSQLDYIEILNEPSYFFSITGSPYTSNAAAADDYYYYTEQAIRSVSTSVKLGGDADAQVGGSFGALATILGDSRLGSTAINFVSYHIYSTDPPNSDQIGAMTTLLNNNGRSGLPIFITEWNYTVNVSSTDPHVSGTEAVPFVGAALLEFMQQTQLSGADYFSLLPNNVNLQQYEDCTCTSTLAFYHWANNQATLFPQASVYQVASQDLGLGAGNFKVYSTSVAGITSALGGLNSNGNAVALLVNDSSSATTTSVSFTNIPTTGSHTVAVYTADANGIATNNGLFPTQVLTGQTFTNGSYTLSVSLPAYSFVGVTIDGNTAGAPDLAAFQSVTASSDIANYGWSKKYVNDTLENSDTTTNKLGWSSTNTASGSNHTEWIQVNLGSSQTIDEVDLYPRNDSGNVGQGFPIDFTIQAAADSSCSTWTTVITETGYPQPGNSVQPFDFPAQTAQCVKIVGTNLRPNPQENNAYYMQLAEIEVYNK